MIPPKNSVKLFHFILRVSVLGTFWWPSPPWNLQKKIRENWFILFCLPKIFLPETADPEMHQWCWWYLSFSTKSCKDLYHVPLELYQGPNPKFGHWQPEKKSWNQNTNWKKKKFVKSKYHWFFIFRDDVIISTNLFGKGFFLVASWDNSHMITHGFGKEDSHLSKTAKTLKKAKKILYFGCKM